MGTGKTIVNFKEFNGRTLSLDPEKGLLVDDVVVEPKISEYSDKVDENDLEVANLISDSSPLFFKKKFRKKYRRKNRIKKAVFLMAGVFLVVGASAFMLKGMKHNDN